MKASMERPEQLPLKALAVNTGAFSLCFAAWVMFGPSARLIAEEMHIDPANAALLKSLPILTGSLMRIPIGILTDRLGARRVFTALAAVAAVAAIVLALSSGWAQLLAGALAFGLIGATFVPGVQSVSSWTPASRQGYAMGIFGAGNVGTALTAFGMPLLLESLGWRGTFLCYGAVLAITAVGYWLLMRDAPARGPARSRLDLLRPLADIRTWRLGLYYAATFGTFVGATLLLSDIYIDAYGVSLRTAGIIATTFTFSSSIARIWGGKCADRFGASAVLRIALAVSLVALALLLAGPVLPITALLFFVAGIAMGIGMAATMRYVPDYFPGSVGAVGGIVGALGGLGGFALPLIAASIKVSTGSVFLQVLPVVVLAGVALAAESAVIFASAPVPALKGASRAAEPVVVEVE